MMNATPRPWNAQYDDNGFYFIDAPGRPSPYIAATGGEGEADKANAALIVRAVNSHEALVDLARNVGGLSLDIDGMSPAAMRQTIREYRDQARAALNLAEPVEP